MFPLPCRFASTISGSERIPQNHFQRTLIDVSVQVRPSPPNIGSIAFLTHRKEEAEAILDGNGRWHCPKMPVLDRVLNALYEPKRFANRDMPFGYGALIEAANWLKGEIRQQRE